ncbi:hypothetical protein SAMN05216203_1020 [Marinobacter daqiaonensis]|uniref:Uncharacterized protein n=1 Tax=Marinobacter daqiaonensis TaxID=650891 RepID=A0A1I6H9V8_9GAMM|nr:hypothetical protein [Marinobacter daqiaonensis]SFR51091.1 hypothetical protein SAMN05216203_1020 [Marinobacter daqiaonensis]
MNGDFNTEQYLSLKVSCDFVFSEIDFVKIDRLCKKVDVVKKVYRSYTPDLSVKMSNEEIGRQPYRDLLELFLVAASSFEDYKFLNTALKLNDLLVEKKFLEEWEAQEVFQKLQCLAIRLMRKTVGHHL